MIEIFRKTNLECSKLITKAYSTSFSLGILAFDAPFRSPIYAIYGFVRYADEIVDTFYGFDQSLLLAEFKVETYKAIERKISLNPILDAFQTVVNEYQIDMALIDAFFQSMEMDLQEIEYELESYKGYIYGSAEVVGLMCLQVFCTNSQSLYESLIPSARSLGAAFQKVNFLRDIKDDYKVRGRTYFPSVDLEGTFSQEAKGIIEDDIRQNFEEAYVGILQLPNGARRGVMVAYRFFLHLFRKICRMSPERIMQERIRISNVEKIRLALSTVLFN
jgi:phytoene/squalene synthetase